jgi:NADPH2:quinone reductase
VNVAVEVEAVGFARYGNPEVLRRMRTAVPPPGPGQVRVRVAATGVNPADTYLRSERFRSSCLSGCPSFQASTSPEWSRRQVLASTGYDLASPSTRP